MKCVNLRMIERLLPINSSITEESQSATNENRISSIEGLGQSTEIMEQTK